MRILPLFFSWFGQMNHRSIPNRGILDCRALPSLATTITSIQSAVTYDHRKRTPRVQEILQLWHSCVASNRLPQRVSLDQRRFHVAMPALTLHDVTPWKRFCQNSRRPAASAAAGLCWRRTTIETALLTIFSFSFNSPRGRAVMELRQAGEHCPLQ